jgi:hypothetical protein
LRNEIFTLLLPASSLGEKERAREREMKKDENYGKQLVDFPELSKERKKMQEEGKVIFLLPLFI